MHRERSVRVPVERHPVQWSILLRGWPNVYDGWMRRLHEHGRSALCRPVLSGWHPVLRRDHAMPEHPAVQRGRVLSAGTGRNADGVWVPRRYNAVQRPVLLRGRADVHVGGVRRLYEHWRRPLCRPVLSDRDAVLRRDNAVPE
jgi:hypothetical protein